MALLHGCEKISFCILAGFAELDPLMPRSDILPRPWNKTVAYLFYSKEDHLIIKYFLNSNFFETLQAMGAQPSVLIEVR